MERTPTEKPKIASTKVPVPFGFLLGVHKPPIKNFQPISTLPLT